MTKEMAAELLAWYDAGHRDLPWRRTKVPYRIWLSEIMLQQTRVEAVIPYYERFLQTCPDIEALAKAPEQVYLKLWEGLGYYSRVRNLHKAACLLCEQYGGQMPSDYKELLSLPGIGDYTASAIASIAFGLAEPAVDGNVLRVCARIQGDYRPIDDLKVKRDFRAQLVEIIPKDRAGDFNQALMELGATVCIPNGAPRCADCPVSHLCHTFQQKTWEQIPVRTPKKARTIAERTVILVRCGNLVGIRRRPDSGLLARMWELPAYEGALKPREIRQQLDKEGWKVTKLLALSPAKHVFTHIEWRMTGYYAELCAPVPELMWVTPDELRGEYALPSAFRTFLEVLEESCNISV